VKLGRRRPGEVEILDGLTAEDSVVVDGTLNVRDGSPVAPRPIADSQAVS
jgi:membrane fusion protein (multidrug efflux system)